MKRGFNDKRHVNVWPVPPSLESLVAELRPVARLGNMRDSLEEIRPIRHVKRYSSAINLGHVDLKENIFNQIQVKELTDRMTCQFASGRSHTDAMDGAGFATVGNCLHPVTWRQHQMTASLSQIATFEPVSFSYRDQNKLHQMTENYFVFARPLDQGVSQRSNELHLDWLNVRGNGAFDMVDRVNPIIISRKQLECLGGKECSNNRSLTNGMRLVNSLCSRRALYGQMRTDGHRYSRYCHGIWGAGLDQEPRCVVKVPRGWLPVRGKEVIPHACHGLYIANCHQGSLIHAIHVDNDTEKRQQKPGLNHTQEWGTQNPKQPPPPPKVISGKQSGCPAPISAPGAPPGISSSVNCLACLGPGIISWGGAATLFLDKKSNFVDWLATVQQAQICLSEGGKTAAIQLAVEFTMPSRQSPPPRLEESAEEDGETSICGCSDLWSANGSSNGLSAADVRKALCSDLDCTPCKPWISWVPGPAVETKGQPNSSSQFLRCNLEGEPAITDMPTVPGLQPSSIQVRRAPQQIPIGHPSTSLLDREDFKPPDYDTSSLPPWQPCELRFDEDGRASGFSPLILSANDVSRVLTACLDGPMTVAIMEFQPAKMLDSSGIERKGRRALTAPNYALTMDLSAVSLYDDEEICGLEFYDKQTDLIDVEWKGTGLLRVIVTTVRRHTPMVALQSGSAAGGNAWRQKSWTDSWGPLCLTDGHIMCLMEGRQVGGRGGLGPLEGQHTGLNISDKLPSEVNPVCQRFIVSVSMEVSTPSAKNRALAGHQVEGVVTFVQSCTPAYINDDVPDAPSLEAFMAGSILALQTRMVDMSYLQLKRAGLRDALRETSTGRVSERVTSTFVPREACESETPSSTHILDAVLENVSDLTASIKVAGGVGYPTDNELGTVTRQRLRASAPTRTQEDKDVLFNIRRDASATFWLDGLLIIEACAEFGSEEGFARLKSRAALLVATQRRLMYEMPAAQARPQFMRAGYFCDLTPFDTVGIWRIDGTFVRHVGPLSCKPLRVHYDALRDMMFVDLRDGTTEVWAHDGDVNN